MDRPSMPYGVVGAVGGRRRSPWAALTFAALSLLVVAVALVHIHPLERQELLSSAKESEMHKLFKSALASQNSEVAKHKAAEEKAQQEVREENEIARGGRPTGHRESDSALFKQAFKDQSKDLAKAHAKALQLKDASERMTSSGTLLPRHHGLSDAKLFADALKSQKEDKKAEKKSLKVDVAAEYMKSHPYDASKRAKKEKIAAELKLILGADSETSTKLKKSTAALHSATASLAAHAHTAGRRQKLEQMRKKHAAHRAAANSIQKRAAAEAHAMEKRNKAHHLLTHAAPKAAPVAHTHDALSESAEKKLVSFLDMAGASNKQRAIRKQEEQDAKQRAEEAKKALEKKAEEAKKQAAKVYTDKTSYAVGDDFGGPAKKKPAAHHDWMHYALAKADTGIKGGYSATDARKAEFARADDIEDALLSGHGFSHHTRGRGGEQSRGRIHG